MRGGAFCGSTPTRSCLMFVARPLPACSPKPNHYLEWLENTTCVFGDMCKMVSDPAADAWHVNGTCPLHSCWFAFVRCRASGMGCASTSQSMCSSQPTGMCLPDCTSFAPVEQLHRRCSKLALPNRRCLRRRSHGRLLMQTSGIGTRANLPVLEATPTELRLEQMAMTA